MKTREQVVLVISDDPSFCSAARRELQGTQPSVRVSSVSNVEAARLVVEDCSPAVIVLEQAAIAEAASNSRARVPALDSVVSSLAAYAPVVVLGTEGDSPELSALVAAGAADYVSPSEESLQTASSLIRHRLVQAQAIVSGASFAEDHQDTQIAARLQEDFGEILRHELNNPLTGILGNAELLLAEVRRTGESAFPKGGLQRLETIAALAVRMRETIRLLSQEWEGRRTFVRTP